MNSEIEATRQRISYWMLEYIKDNDDPPYTSADVDECYDMLGSFIEGVVNSDRKTDFDWIASEVKKLVLALNEFNEKNDHTIIETDQREGICALIDQVITCAGHSATEDITEEWREW